ncbi:hypothetical protein Zmor_015247 [Zophobas morio]|uniref:Sjoegren syndrome nuclear autoantigen 1 n=1 Tax=Zophobas morio TaxID=2755281 RepID=A0AA38MGE7_9CUCU|nr:hypothetical protein Zmor_015247 [Zophobas morio]
MKRNNMSQHGATLQTYNQELVKCLEDLRTKRKDLLQVVQQEEQEKATIEKNIETLQDKLSGVCDNLEKHKTLCESYDRTIRDTEAGFKKILESSHLLLNLAQQEATKLNVFNKNKPSGKDNQPYH